MNSIRGQHGFTLLEVILSISILVVIMMASTMMMRSAMDMRAEVSSLNQSTHRYAAAMGRLSDDLQHAFLLSSNEEYLNSLNLTDRKVSTIFRYTKEGGSTVLSFTTMNHSPYGYNAKESDQTFVVYELKSDPDGRDRDRTHLYRGQTDVIPERFEVRDVETRILAKDIKSFEVVGWRGDDWANDRWDSSRSDWRNLLPSMVKVMIEAYDVEVSEGQDVIWDDQPTVKLQTMVYLNRWWGMKHLRKPNSSIRWF